MDLTLSSHFTASSLLCHIPHHLRAKTAELGQRWCCSTACPLLHTRFCRLPLYITAQRASFLCSTLSDRLLSRRLARIYLASETIYSLVSPSLHFYLGYSRLKRAQLQEAGMYPCKTLHRLPLPPLFTTATFCCRYTFFPLAHIRFTAIDTC